MLDSWMEQRRRLLESYLTELLATVDIDAEGLRSAVKYSVLNGGKRIRPLLLWASGEMFGAATDKLLAPAAALELVHCYSLIHDDLPAMDDDDLRRGRESCHKKYGEATAILSGDGLQTLAFSVLTKTDLPPKIAMQLINILSTNAGLFGMVDGQAIDMQYEKSQVSIEQLKTMHNKKTGALIQAALTMGAVGAGIKQNAILRQLEKIGTWLGLAFQIKDDILDVTANSAVLGKPACSDIAKTKSTYVSMLGLAQAEQEAFDYYQKITQEIDKIPTDNNHALYALSKYIINREY